LGSTSIGEPASGYPEANEYFEKGLMFMRTQLDMARAQAMLDRAIEIDPSYGSARSMRALVDLIAIHEGFSNDPGAVYDTESELRRVVSEHGNLASAHAVLGAALLYLNRKEQAREAFAAARRLNPMSQPVEVWSVLDDRLSDRLEQGAARARQVLEATPLFWAARIILSDVLFDQGRLDEARIEIDKVFEQDPNNLGAQRALARWLLYRGDVAEARRLLEQIGAANHENFRVRLVWALQLAREGRSADALDGLDDEVRKYAGIAMFAQAQVAEIYALASRSDDALDWLDRAVRAGDERSGWLRRDVLLDGIRDDPRFGAILDTIDRGKD
jgi:tetratricopeptide (TPR) repeat protein